jgi:hypothetical protein
MIGVLKIERNPTQWPRRRKENTFGLLMSNQRGDRRKRKILAVRRRN